jgi:RNA polymerase sigma-70 factor (ECF subfamily)
MSDRIPTPTVCAGAPERESERDLVERARVNDRGAREELAGRLRQPAFLLALQLLGNREDARDVAQDAVLRFFVSLRRFDSSRPVLPWLRRIVVNRARDLHRRRRLRMAQSLDSGGPEGNPLEVAGTDANPEAEAARRELHLLVWRAVASLKRAQCEILVLRDYQDLSYREIAEVLQIPMGTVMSRLHTARRQLRELLVERGVLDRARSGGSGEGSVNRL